MCIRDRRRAGGFLGGFEESDVAHQHQLGLVGHAIGLLGGRQLAHAHGDHAQDVYKRQPEKMGVSPKGAKVHVAIAAWPWGAYLGEEALSQGIRVKVSSFARQHVNVTMPRAKVATTYANSILANTEALQDGYDEALLLDTEGFVAEGSGENLFLVKDGVLCEPEIASALTGITRSTIHALAADFGLRVVTKRLTRDDVYIADEAFFTGTAAEVTPIREVDNRQIGSGRRGPVTEKLQKAFFDMVNGLSLIHI